MAFKLDYDKLILLDAEDLAEGGILRAYESLRSALTQYGAKPIQLQELYDNNNSSYTVKCGEHDYPIYAPGLPDDEGQPWGRAAYAFFKIVNDQLSQSEYRLYAINGGNDLSGIFLTPAECEAARKSLPRKEDWPYLPTLDHPWYGQPHG